MEAESPAVLFALSDTGGGHRSAALAISAALAEESAGTLSSHVMDTLLATNVPLVRNSPKLYDNLSTRWLPIYNTGFRMTNSRPWFELISGLFDIRVTPRTARFLQTLHPQLVVATHPLTQRFIDSARRRYRIPLHLVTVVTDLVSLHYSWMYKGVDLCLVPTDEAYDLMRRRGMPVSKMQRTGFPVHPKFTRNTTTPATARQALALDAHRFTLLLMGGGVGSGRLHELVPVLERVYPDYHLLVITGKNRALYQQLAAGARSPHTRLFGFVDNMDELMAASDIVITKAGPGTLMEALVMRRPVIITQAVGVQEQGNIDFVQQRNLGLFCPTADEICAAIHTLSAPDRYARTVANLQDGVPRDGAAQIARLLLDQLEQPIQLRRRPSRLQRALRQGSFRSR